MTRPLRLLCIGLLAFGLAVAAYSAMQRVQVDAYSDRVMVLVDWRELNQLLDRSPKPATAAMYAYSTDWKARAVADHRSPITDRSAHKAPWELLSKLSGAYIAYGEETVGDLLLQGIISPADTTTTGPTYEVSDFEYSEDIERGAKRHGYAIERQGGRLLVQLPPPGPDGVNALPVCWRSDVIATVRSHNILCILRPAGTELFSADGLEETLEFAKDQPLMLFQGTQVPGFPHRVKDVALRIQGQAQLFGWVEFDEQDGAAQLASLTAPGVARVHSITAEEMEKYTVARAVERYELALTERSVRVLFVRPFLRPGLNAGEGSYREQVLSINADYFTELGLMIKESGFKIGRPQPFGFLTRPVDKLRTVAVGLATVAATLLLLSLLVPRLTTRWTVALLALGAICAISGAFIPMLYTLKLLLAGIVFPLLGFWVALLLYQRAVHGAPAASFARLGWALTALAVATAISAAGGLLIHGGMWDARTLLRIDQYRGVTLALALPVLLVAAYCWHAESLHDAWDGAGRRLAGFWQRFLALWLAPIRYGDVAVILLAVGALGIVLLRSGNEGPLGVLGAEGWLRGFLESALEVRPRTKELLGHPLLVLFLLTLPWRTRLSLLFALGGILGQVSVLNTFEHLHTPLLITLQRVGVGLLIGIVTGGMLGAVAIMLARFFAKPSAQPVRSEPTPEEPARVPS